MSSTLALSHSRLSSTNIRFRGNLGNNNIMMTCMMTANLPQLLNLLSSADGDKVKTDLLLFALSTSRVDLSFGLLTL